MTFCKKDSDLNDAVCTVLFFKVKGSEGKSHFTSDPWA